MVANILTAHPEDDVLRDIRRVIADTLQVARDNQRVQALRRQLRFLFYERA